MTAIDLRSDLLALPTEEMWAAMQSAELGWASFGEDASVNALEERVAGLLGKESGLWAPTCGMANLVALLATTERGQVAVLESTAHILTSEGMWITDTAGLEPRSVWAADGRPDPAAVEEIMREQPVAVLCLENTHTRAGGTVLSVEQTEALADVAHRHGARVHLDGARLLNAAVALGVPAAALAAGADTVSLSLNKGLCAPMGTILAGPEAVIADARGHLRRLGGGTVHRAGIPAAASLVALETMVDRLADDHRRARALAAAIAGIDGLVLRPGTVETNIVLVDVSALGVDAETFVAALSTRGVRAMARDTSRIRLVTHRLTGETEIERAVAALRETAAELRP
jgi:threonine aldolase